MLSYKPASCSQFLIESSLAYHEPPAISKTLPPTYFNIRIVIYTSLELEFLEKFKKKPPWKNQGGMLPGTRLELARMLPSEGF